MTPAQTLALELSSDRVLSPSNLDRVASQVGPEVARWAFGQWQLRERARTKFERSMEMLFVGEALEQATHERVAAWRAGQFPTGACVADVTAGIGADLVALARRGPVVGYELDAERAGAARHNLSIHGLQGLVLEADGLQATEEYLVGDPARRVDGRRTLSLGEFTPNPHEIVSQFASRRLVALKLSPMLSDRDLTSLGPRLDFVSFRGECREACVWFGTEAVPGWQALQAESGATWEGSTEPLGDIGTDTPQTYLYQLDPAAVRAHVRPEIPRLGGAPAYFTSDRWIESPWFRAYRVVSAVKMDVKAIRAELRRLRARVTEVKVSGAKVDGPKTLREIRAEGERELSLCLWSQEKRIVGALVERAT